MDGNRRWAKERALPTLAGHTKGYQKLKEVISWVYEMEIPNIIFYTFSTENWNRKKEEVEYLMDLFEKKITNDFEEIKKKNIRVLFIGQKEKFSKTLQKVMKQHEDDTADNTHGTVVFALSYGGRTEIIHAVNRALKEKKYKTVDEDTFSKILWTEDVPDPDIIIRTGGEKRLSNFLTWQSVYSELFFSDTLWPDFSKKEFTSILENFSNRERRRGK